MDPEKIKQQIIIDFSKKIKRIETRHRDDGIAFMQMIMVLDPIEQIDISIIMLNPPAYAGIRCGQIVLEIYSKNILFDDVERFDNYEDLKTRLDEIIKLWFYECQKKSINKFITKNREFNYQNTNLKVKKFDDALAEEQFDFTLGLSKEKKPPKPKKIKGVH